MYIILYMNEYIIKKKNQGTNVPRTSLQIYIITIISQHSFQFEHLL